MFNDSVSFNGGTRVEVIAVLANCGRDTDRARRALVTWIRHKQTKNRSTEHILAKLRDIESKFINDTSLHSAFRDARAETFLPRPPDLPLPDSIRRRAGSQSIPESAPYTSPPLRPSSMSSQVPALLTQQSSPQRPSSHSSGGSSQISELSFGKSKPYGPYPSRPIQIPHTEGPPRPSSPITSSPEDSGIHIRYHHLSHPVGSSSQPHGPAPPHSASSLESPVIFRRQYSDPHGYMFHHVAPPEPSPRQPRRSIPQTTGTSSDESDIRHHHMSRTAGRASPGRSRVTPPKTCPPDLPLPPIPSNDQGADSDDEASKKSMSMEEPPTPLRSCATHASTPVRPLPIQPIPSPIPGSEEWEHIDMLNGNSLRQCWHESNGELPLMREVAREDSPVFAFNEDRASQMPPPPYVTQLDDHSPEVPVIGDALDRAVSMCGGSQEVRHEISRCIKYHRGYEPPYWQTRLQACGLNAAAAKYLVDEMSKQVDWAASVNRVTG